MKGFGKKESSSTPEEAPVKKVRGRKKKENAAAPSEVSSALAAPFNAGSTKANASFLNTVKIDDSSIDIDDRKSLKRERKGRSGLSLGTKYSGKRRNFLILGLALAVAVLSSLFALSTSLSKPSSSQVKADVKKEVANSVSSKFPVGTASMWLEQFVRTWGTWNYKTPDARATDLSTFLAPGLDPQAGWNSQGTQSVLYAAVSSTPQMIDSNRAIFDTTYQIQDGTWRCAKVPVYAYQITNASQGPVGSWGLTVTANPTPESCPLRVSVPSFAETSFSNTDAADAATLQSNFFPGFFSAWVTSNANALQQYMGPNVKTYGLGSAYSSNVKIDSVILPVPESAKDQTVADKTVYTAYATVDLTDTSGATVTATYKVPVMKNGGQWQVMGEPSAVTQALSVAGGGTVTPNGRKPASASSSATATQSYATPSTGQAGASATETPAVSSKAASSTASPTKK